MSRSLGLMFRISTLCAIMLCVANACQHAPEPARVDPLDREDYPEIAVRDDLSASDRAVIKVFARIDKLGFALSTGIVSGLLIFLALLLLTSFGNGITTQDLQLLNQYFIGYTVSVEGSFIGMGYTFIWGFLFGWLFAYLNNLFVAFHIYRVRRKLELLSFRDFLDHF